MEIAHSVAIVLRSLCRCLVTGFSDLTWVSSELSNAWTEAPWLLGLYVRILHSLLPYVLFSTLYDSYNNQQLFDQSLSNVWSSWWRLRFESFEVVIEVLKLRYYVTSTDKYEWLLTFRLCWCLHFKGKVVPEGGGRAPLQHVRENLPFVTAVG
jgi:hypothetical protein